MTTEEIVWEEIDKVRKENLAITELWKNQIAANLKLNNEVNEINEKMVYWKQRCDFAEKLLDKFPTLVYDKSDIYTKWQTLKQKQL